MSSVFSLYATLKERIASRQAHVMTVGLGYVGLPLALTVNESGFPTTGLDLNASRVARINAGEAVISYLPPNRIADAVKTGTFRATADFAALKTAEVILICVPTPLSDEREPDLTYVIRAVEAIAAQLQPGQLVVLESTVWPGATTTVIKPILETSGLRAGVDFFLGFSPEREDPGSATHSTKTIPKVVGADDTHSRNLLDQFYSAIVTSTVPVSSSATAEAVKLVENSFRTVNIALINELKVALDAMGVDVWEVVKAAATKPFGYMPFYPGPGIGGDCIPVSPVYLSWRARDVGSSVPIIDLARHNNEAAPDMLAGRIAVELSKRDRSMTGARLLMLGIAYKKNVEDTRESPALYLLQRLEAMGATCDYHDPFFPTLPPTRDHPDLAGRHSLTLTEDALAGYDAVIVATDHSNVDYGLIAANSALVLDCRNVFAAQGIAPQAGKYKKI